MTTLATLNPNSLKHSVHIACTALFLSLLLLVSCKDKVPAEDSLVMAAIAFNATCPRMVDQDTRLDSAFFIPDTVFQYDYTLVNYDRESIDAESLARYLKPRIINNVSQNPEMKPQRDLRITMVFFYRDRKGAFITQLVIGPEDYLF
jgi:hypothetical protein